MARPDPNDLFQAHPFNDWHEDLGDVLWWRLPVQEAPYCGSPLDLGQEVKISLAVESADRRAYGAYNRTLRVGGWPFEEADQPNLVWTLLPGAIRWP
jgi:hypothetical protein